VPRLAVRWNFPSNLSVQVVRCRGKIADMFHGYAPLHITNIFVHVLAGVFAIICGTIAIVSAKGKPVHVKAGWLFIYAYVVLAITAVFGIVIFEFRSFLAVATIASSYDVFAGYRSLRLRGRRPQSIDICLSVVALLAPVVFVFAMRVLHKPWSPALTWSVLGGLMALAAYDLARVVLPLSWLRRVWIQEHLYKMLMAYIAALATAGATIFPRLSPWSALVPVILGEAMTLCFLIAWRSPVARRLVPDASLSGPASS
jgi:hypothetical protein